MHKPGSAIDPEHRITLLKARCSACSGIPTCQEWSSSKFRFFQCCGQDLYGATLWSHSHRETISKKWLPSHRHQWHPCWRGHAKQTVICGSMCGWGFRKQASCSMMIIHLETALMPPPHSMNENASEAICLPEDSAFILANFWGKKTRHRGQCQTSSTRNGNQALQQTKPHSQS